MKELWKAICRPSGRITDIFLIGLILTTAIALFGTLLSEVLFLVLGVKPFLTGLLGDGDSAAFLLMYLSFLGNWLVFFVVISVFKANRPIWKCLSFRSEGNGMGAIATGLLLGFGTNGFCILMACLMGDLKLYYYKFEPLPFFLFLFAVIVQSGAEEIVDRCYLYQKLRRRYRHPAVALLISSLYFALMHIANDNFSVSALVDIFITGLLFALFVYYYDSLWTAIMFHAGWNFTQSILFGLPNSGFVSKYSLFKLDAASARNGFFYNVGFGVEGSIGSIIVLLVVTVIVLFLNYGKREKRDLWG